MRPPAFVLGAAFAALASPALAQQSAPSEDWDLTANAEQQLTLATVDFGENVLALRCRAGALDLLLTGVPASVGTTRRIRVSAGGIVEEDQIWAAQAGQPVLGADEPARLARQLRAGGDLDLRIDKETDADRPRRYRLTAPASAASVDAVLTACGEPLAEPRDLIRRAGAGPGLLWEVAPTSEFPRTPAALRSNGGGVRVSCVIGADWGLQDCRVESEQPEGLGFGASAVAGALQARVRPPADGSDMRGQLVRFSARFSPISSSSGD